MTETTEDFHTGLFAEIRAASDAGGRFLETAFLEHYGAWLVDSGELESFDIAPYVGARGIRVDAYGGDPVEAEGILSLVISEFSADEAVRSIPPSEIDTIFNRLRNFFLNALKPDFRHQMEETSPGFGIAELISARRSVTTRVRLFLLTNRALISRYERTDVEPLDGLPVTLNVWDVTRLQRLVESGRGREEIEIDLQEEFGQSLPCLPAHLGQDDYEAYLVVIPGELLARIYDKWGARLLEQNVRSFLQARGSVNKGIRGTILNDPGMFFAYNNGVTATAENVVTETEGGATRILRLRNLQIVNGGQTTASIFSARKRDKADLSRVFVQMKLSVVQPARAMEVVPRISEFANSQNRVNAADFFANHPFHVRMEEFSRRIWAPAADGSFRQSKWFYERARGQFLDAKANLTQARRKAFEEEYPKLQSFAKTDLAKSEMVWEEKPFIVSRGAQHNFAEFARLIGSRWAKDEDQVNELFFRAAVARLILFRATEKLVSARPWYDGGYRAQLVAYAISKLDQIIRGRGRVLDFEMIWKAQALPAALERAMIHIIDAVRVPVSEPGAGTANVTEWAKKQACWARVMDTEVTLDADFSSLLIDAAAQKAARSDARKTQKIDNGIEAQTRVISLGSTFWASAASFATQRRLLAPADHSLLALAARRSAIPTEKQSARLIECLATLETEGLNVPT